jgi:tRNA pseudouridine55 synthase
MNEGAPGGVLLLDKPVGISSFQALRPLKRLFPKTKIGHAGTLDPAASGLLLIGIGSGTRLLEYLEGMTKTYSFAARFGYVSDSYDMEGAVEPYPPAPDAADLSADSIGKALGNFRGPIRQTPPVYSAIKLGGERACDRVRAGETVTLESREVVIHSLELKSFSASGEPAPAPAQPAYTAVAAGAPGTASAAGSDAAGNAGGADETAERDRGFRDQAYAAPFATLEMTCSKGTYVRSLVNDLGVLLGRGAVTDKIRRLAIGPFRVEDAYSPGDLAPGIRLLPLETAVTHLPAATVPAEWVARFLNGQAAPAIPETSGMPVSGSPADQPGVPDEASLPDREYRALDPSGRLLAIATLSPQGLLCPRKVLAKA